MVSHTVGFLPLRLHAYSQDRGNKTDHIWEASFLMAPLVDLLVVLVTEQYIATSLDANNEIRTQSWIC